MYIPAIAEEVFVQTNAWYSDKVLVADPRVSSWPLMQTLTPTYLLSGLYLLLVCVVGPKFMQSRQPFELKPLLIVYNLALTILNAYITWELLVGMIMAGYSWPCGVLGNDPDLNGADMRIASALWWYFVSKLIEFLDTIFFVMRKKERQVTFLHVYHHFSMPLLWVIFVKWHPGGQLAHNAIFNAFIHIIMYAYYGLSALGPHMQPYLWWKRYLTQMQLIQFCLEIVVIASNMYTGCPFPLAWQYIGIAYVTSFLFLFGQFYIRSYLKKQK